MLDSPNPIQTEKQLQGIDFTRPEKTTPGHFVSNHLLARSKSAGEPRRDILSQICRNLESIHSRLNHRLPPILWVIESPNHAPVAQLDRASAFEAEGREFESLRARHFF
jgi:hypothetical protein